MVRKAKLPRNVGQGMAETLERRVARCTPGVTRMQIDAVGIALPDFDPYLRNRLCVEVENAASEVQEVAAGFFPCTVDVEQIGIVVAWPADRIEGSLCSSRRGHEFAQRRSWQQ